MNYFNYKLDLFFWVFVLLCFIFLVPLYVLGSRFKKTITIKTKYTTSSGSKIVYTVVDSNNNVYTIENVWFFGNFEKAQIYNSININSNYNVSGYGYTINMISLYPSIYGVTSA